MQKNYRPIATIIAFIAIIFSGKTVLAHVPYFEHIDFTESSPFTVKNSVEQSIAVYSWLEVNADDIDVYEFVLDAPAQVYVETLVPVCTVYDTFFPFFAIVGPGLPPLPEGDKVPFDIPEGSGIVIVPNDASPEERPMFYEFFGNKNYYEGPTFDDYFETPGRYRIYVWDPESVNGDYVAVIGNKEIWGFKDILRAFIYTPLIRQGKELHTDDCVNP